MDTKQCIVVQVVYNEVLDWAVWFVNIVGAKRMERFE